MAPIKTPSPSTPSEAVTRFVRQRRSRNIALFGVLLFMVTLFFAITIAQMSR